MSDFAMGVRGLLPLAQETTSRTFFEAMRLRQLDEWWHWLALLAVSIGVLVYTWQIYRRDTPHWSLAKRWLLLLLRVTAIVGIVIFLLDIQKRSEQKIVKNSRVAILVDTSQSMGIADIASSADQERASNTNKETRISQVTDRFQNSNVLTRLREKHDVTVYRFDETNVPAEVATFPQVSADAESLEGESDSSAAAESEVAGWLMAAIALFSVGVVAAIAHGVASGLFRSAEGESWALLVGVLAFLLAGVMFAMSNLRHPEIDPLVALGWQNRSASPSSSPDSSQPQPNGQEVAEDADAFRVSEPSEIDWVNKLEPAGGSTRLGDAIAWLLQHERSSPLAGIGIITDGNGNRGVEPELVASVARADEVPLFPVGVASDLPPRNVRLVDLEAPSRVFPGDEFQMTGYIQAYGLGSRSLVVRLYSRPAEDASPPNPSGANPTDADAEGRVASEDRSATATTGAQDLVLEEQLTVELRGDGEVTPIPIKLIPLELGRRVYELQLADDRVDENPADNQVQAKVNVVDRKSNVLLLAGGPTREYRFIRNMLYRDKDTKVDVVLQTAMEGISQEADDILSDLPTEPADLFDYDCILAFDPDWNRFDVMQLRLLERWVAEKAGGLICIAGPVYTASWAETRRPLSHIETVKQLYPVQFYSLNSARIELGRYASATAWPLDLTDAGMTAPFFAIGEDGRSADAWDRFAGVYGYYPTRDVKPGATIYARYSDPQADVDGQLPPLVVGQFYGAGRVMFLGTGEFWRLRSIDDGFFERFYTKLIRYVSEGRLLRDSNRGLLLVDKERALRGDAIAVRANVVDEQFEPLRNATLEADLIAPDGRSQKLSLQRVDGELEGIFAGRFVASQEGEYRVELPLPGVGEPIVLQREVRVRLPNLEIERPQRNDAVLQNLADQTGGRYFVGMAAATAPDGDSLPSAIASKRRETFLPGSPDRAFQGRLMTWLMALICGSLFLEWLIRRLNKLA